MTSDYSVSTNSSFKTTTIGKQTLFSQKKPTSSSFVSSSLLLELPCHWLLMYNDILCFWLDLKQVQLDQSAARWPYLRQLKLNFFELTTCLRFTGSFTSVQSFILCPVRSHNTHFRFVAFCWSVLKFLSLPSDGFSFHVSVTGLLLTHCLNASISLEKSHCCHSLSSLSKSDQISGILSSVFPTYHSMVLSFPILSSECVGVCSFS